MRIVKSKLSKLLIYILIANFVFSNLYIDIFASNNTNTKNIQLRNTKFSFDWQKTLVLTDILETKDRENGSNEVFLTWNFEKDNDGLNIGTGNYELTYNIDDTKKAKFLVEKRNNVANVSYFIDATEPNSNSKTTFQQEESYKNDIQEGDGFQVYKSDSGTYLTPNSSNYPEISNTFKINYDEDGTAKKVSFTIAKNNGFSFKYKNNVIRFKWNSNGKFYFSTDGVKQGNIYDFVLKVNINQNSIEEKIQIFNNINSTNLFVNPKANEGKAIIDQTVRPINEYPGDNSELEIEFEMPKVWNEDKRKYEFLEPTSVKNTIPKTEVVFNLSHSDDNKKIQINIEDIYKDFTSKGETKLDIKYTSNTSEISAVRDSSGQKIKIYIKKLEAGTIYNPVTVSVARPSEDKFLTVPFNVDFGKFYTYTKFSIVSLGTNEFYIKITPFEKYNGYYTVMYGDTASTLQKWSLYEEKNNGVEDILIPVNLNVVNNQEKYFQIRFSLTPPNDEIVDSSTSFVSQTLKYKPSEADIILGTPDNFKVLDSTVVLNPTTLKSELIAEFSWDMSYESTLKYLVSNNKEQPLDIFYTFYKNEKPLDSNSEEFAKIKVNVSNQDGKIDLKIQEEGDKNYLNEAYFSEREIINSNERQKVISIKVKFKIPVSSKEEASEQFVYPSINFVTVKGEYEIGSQKIVTSSSLPTDITINEALFIEIPQPQDGSIENVTRDSFEFKFKTMSWEEKNSILYNYKTDLLEKLGFILKEDSIKYNFYITKDKSLINSLINNEPEINNKLKSFDYKEMTLDSFNVSEEIIENNKIIDLLRENYIFELKNVAQNNIKDEKQTIKITGLDENQIYYIVAKAFVTPYNDKGDKKMEDFMQSSKFSTILTLTTLKDIEGPNESEKEPATPQNFVVQDVTFNSAKLVWDKVDESNEKSDIEYQFIKIKGEQLKEEFLKTKDSYQKTWDNINISEKTGFKTSLDEVLLYSEKSNSFTEIKDNSIEYSNVIGDKREILDKTLKTNKIYFYYIRAVRVVDGKDVAYSFWVPLSVTTKNVEAPKNLKVEPSKIENKSREIVISFDIPNISLENLKTNYKIQYSIKKDNEKWSDDYTIDPNDAQFTKNQDGSIKVTYTIKNLLHSSLYSIKVKLYDIELNSSSNYTNEVTHRTDLDKVESEYDEVTEDWKQNYEELVEKLKNQPYWFLNNNLSTTSVVYRPKYIESVLNYKNSNIIDLETGLDGVKKEYYIPASEIKKIFDDNKGFRITFKDSELIFSPRSINPNENDSIKSILELIQKGSIKDYFIKITVIFNEGNYSVNGNNSLSPRLDVALQSVGTSKLLEEWDEYMYETLESILEDYFNKETLDEIKEMVRNNKLNTEILTYINKRISQLEEILSRKLSSQISGITKRTYLSENLNGNLIFAYPINSNITVSGYILDGYGWSNINISNYKNKKAIYSNKLTSYIFAGQKSIIVGIDNIENGSLITEIISKYNLQDYLGKGSSIDLNNKITRNEAIGISARVMGASRYLDPISFFKSKGIILSTRNLEKSITTQEAIFLIMKVYESRTNTKLESIRIKNYSLVSGIQNLNSNYKKAVQVAFDLGIYSNSNMNSNGDITVKEFLQVLSNLIKKVGL